MRIGLFCTDASDIYQRELVGAFSKRAAAEGHVVSVFSTQVLEQDPELASPENRLFSFLSSGLFEGLVLTADSLFHHLSSQRILDSLAALGTTPWVSIEKTDWEAPGAALDNIAALPELIDHLHGEHGYRDFLVLLGPASSVDARERAACVLDALSSKPEARWDTLVCDFLEDKAYQSVLARLREPSRTVPDVILALNDNMAMGALRALRALGLTCPGDCAVTGFDDVEEAALEDPALTTIRHPLDDLATEALRALTRPRGEPVTPRRLVPTRLVVRESCGCNRARDDGRDIRSLLSLIQSLRIRGETLFRASSTFGAHASGAVDLEGLLSHLGDACRSLSVPELRLLLADSEAVPEGGLPDQWREVFRHGGEPFDSSKRTELSQFVASSPQPADSGLVYSVNLLYDHRQVYGLLGTLVPVGWLGFVRMLATNLSTGLNRVSRWQSLLGHAVDLEVSVAQRNRDLVDSNRALRQEIERRRVLEQTLSSERQALRDILEAQPIALVILNAADLSIRYHNGPFARLLGLEATAAASSLESLSSLYGPLLRRTGIAESSSMTAELTLPTQDGREVPVLVGRAEVALQGEKSLLVGMMDLSVQKQLEHDLLNVRENDSRRFGQELHDDVCQKLAALAVFTSILDQKLATRTGSRVPEVAELSALTKGILDHARDLSRGLFPIEVGNLPLGKLIERLLNQVHAQTGLVFHWSTNWIQRPAEIGTSEELHLFRIVQEAIQNTIRHSGATAVEVSLHVEAGGIRLEYSDNGRGPPAGFVEGLGLRSMRYRASQLGAVLTCSLGAQGGLALTLSHRLQNKRVES